MKIGIDLGGSHIAIGIVDKSGKILEKVEKRLTKLERRDIKKSIEEIIIENVNLFVKKYEITELGIAMPGWAKNGMVMTSGNIGIENYPMIQILQKKIHLPIKIRNDAKCAGLAENKYGCLKGYRDSIFLTLGTGIGGAIFLDDKLLESKRRNGSEVGHMVIIKDGIPCTCGRKGCFERYASMKALKNNLRKALKVDETTRGEELLNIIRKNKPEHEKYETIENVVSEYIENLSLGITNLINIFEPEVIGIGGSFVYFEDVLLPRLKEKILEENKKCVGREKLQIETAILGNDAGIIGAVL